MWVWWFFKWSIFAEVQETARKNVSINIFENIRSVKIENSTNKTIVQKVRRPVVKPLAKSICKKLSLNFSFSLVSVLK